MKEFNLEKEQIRGAIKQIMKVQGLRTISLANYDKWRGIENNGIHSIKFNLMAGYINLYETNPLNGKCGKELEDVPSTVYRNAYDKVKEIIDQSANIPTKKRRNILVKLSR